MSIAHSKLTAQGQISVPAEVRKRLGIGPGSVLEWYEQDGALMVRRAGLYSSDEIHRALFASSVGEPGGAIDVKQAIRQQMRKRHARS